jgi:plastocyanin
MHRPSFSPLRAALLFGLSTVTVVACDDDDDGGGPSNDLVIAKATPSGDAQTGPVGAALAEPLQVVVTLDGAPLEGEEVTFAATNGTVDPLTDLTDVNGIASTTWTLGTTSGAQAASATLDGAGGSPVGFTATGTATAATEIVAVSGDGQAGEIGDPLAAPMIVKITDEFGNGVEAEDVTFAVGTGDATVNPLTAQSDVAGEAQTVVTFGPTAGEVTVTATSGVLTGSPVTFTLQSGHFVVSNDVFTPTTVTVPVGTEVRWVWQVGAVGHNITPVAPSTEPTGTPSLSNNAPFQYSHTFNTPGTYNFECTNHPATMQGTVTVTP